MKPFVCLAVLACLALGLAYADPKPGKGNGNGKGKGREAHESHQVQQRTQVVVAVRHFRPDDRVVIVDYYRGRPGGLPPGLAKRGGDLPPGLEKQLRRNGRLPPGLEKKLVYFPAELEMRLPPCPPDVRRGFIGGFAIAWNSRTGTIVDIVATYAR
jgi:hypothetical protein